MPLVSCVKDGNPGYKYGENNESCFTYIPGNAKSQAAAKLKAIHQGFIVAKNSGESFKP